jgi:Carboxypeptidase regulatory-like domain
MSTKSLQIGFILLGSALLMGSLRAATPTIQGEIKGPDGKPLAGAEVRIERKDAKAPAVTVTADKNGRYVFKNLALGSYKVMASKNGVVATAADNIRTRAEGPVRVDFDLKNPTGEAKASASAKKGKHMVWVAADTGTHLGGRWVEVDDQGSAAAGANNIDRASGEALRKHMSLTPDSTPSGR